MEELGQGEKARKRDIRRRHYWPLADARCRWGMPTREFILIDDIFVSLLRVVEN